MRIAIGGASGLIGSFLVPALRAAGHDVVELVRRAPTRPDEVRWDPAADAIDLPRLAGVDGLVTLNGATIGRRWTESRKRDILASRVASTRVLAQAAANLEPRPAVLVHAGGVGIYGDRGDEILTEESPLGDDFLAEVGKAWEAAAEPARAAGVRVVSFRQGIVLTRRGGALQRLLTPFRLGLGGRIGSGRQWWSWVAPADVVAAYRFALERDGLSGAVNLGSPNPARNSELTRALGRALGRPTVFPLPSSAVRLVFGEMGESVLLAGQRALPARLLDAGFAFSEPELDSALERALAG